MKNVKMPGITTKEGFELRNLQRFPSMEFGDEGGLQVDIYYNKHKIMQVYQEGNGGPAITYTEQYYLDHKTEIDLQCLRFLKRVDENYGPNSEFASLRNKRINNIDDDDWEALANNIEEYYDDVKAAAKSFRAGYKAVVALKCPWQTDYLQYRVADITDKEVAAWLAKNDTKKKYTHYIILLPVPELSIL